MLREPDRARRPRREGTWQVQSPTTLSAVSPTRLTRRPIARARTSIPDSRGAAAGPWAIASGCPTPATLQALTGRVPGNIDEDRYFPGVGSTRRSGGPLAVHQIAEALNIFRPQDFRSRAVTFSLQLSDGRDRGARLGAPVPRPKVIPPPPRPNGMKREGKPRGPVIQDGCSKVGSSLLPRPVRASRRLKPDRAGGNAHPWLEETCLCRGTPVLCAILHGPPRAWPQLAFGGANGTPRTSWGPAGFPRCFGTPRADPKLGAFLLLGARRGF